MSGLEEKQNNTIKLTLNELLCGFLGESLFIFFDLSIQVLSTNLTYGLDNADTERLRFILKLMIICVFGETLIHFSIKLLFLSDHL